MTFYTGGGERVRLDTNGNLGIGTNSPTNRVEVNGGSLFSSTSISSKSALQVTGAFGGGITILDTLESGIYADSVGARLNFYVGRNTSTQTPESKVALAINSSGNVLVGASSFAYTAKVNVNGSQYMTGGSYETWAGGYNLYNSTNNYIGVQFYKGTSAITGSTRQAVVETQIDNGLILRTDVAIPIIFVTNASEKMRLNTNGALRINTTAYGASNDAKLVVCGGTGIWSERQILVEHSGGDQPGIGFHAPTVSAAAIFKYYGPGNRFECRSAADTTFVDIYAASCVNASDHRLKKDVSPFDGGLSAVMQLKPSNFTWIDKDRSAVGFIAHEVQSVIPTAVIGEKDAIDANGNAVYQGIDTLQIVATLVSAVQELSAKLDEANARIAQLEGTN